MTDIREQAAAAARECAYRNGSIACKDYGGHVACAAGYELGHAAGFAAGARAFAEWCDGQEPDATAHQGCGGGCYSDCLEVIDDFLSSLAPGTGLETGEGQKEEGA